MFSIAAAALDAPDDPVRDVVFPAVSGGEQTLRELVHEYKTQGPVYRRTVQTTLKASYTNHYRRGLIELLEVLAFRSNNTTHRPVLDALDLVARQADAKLTYYPVGEHVPTHKGIVADWEALVYRTDERGHQRAPRTRSAPSRHCGNGYGARRSGSRARTGGATPTRTCRPTSKTGGWSTTPRCASRWTRPRSSTNSKTSCVASSPPSTSNCPAWTGSTSSTAASRARSS